MPRAGQTSQLSPNIKKSKATLLEGLWFPWMQTAVSEVKMTSAGIIHHMFLSAYPHFLPGQTPVLLTVIVLLLPQSVEKAKAQQP